MADAPIAVYDTPNCPAAAVWNTGYRLWWRTDTAQTTTRDVLDDVLEAADGFTQAAGVHSNCALAVHLEVYDMGDDVWQRTDSGDPPAHRAFRVSRDYDQTFDRFPASNENYSGLASSTFPFWSKFPVDATGKQLSCGGCPTDPNRWLLMHEWLHQVVAFYSPIRQGWPRNDVHGACEHGYQDAPCYVNERYFADMLQGRVAENGVQRGLLPADVVERGTPAHRRDRQRRSLGISRLTLGGQRSLRALRHAGGMLRVRVNITAAGTVAVTARGVRRGNYGSGRRKASGAGSYSVRVRLRMRALTRRVLSRRSVVLVVAARVVRADGNSVRRSVRIRITP
jgi:hypothetical protein